MSCSVGSGASFWLFRPVGIPRYRPGLEGQALDSVQGVGACTHLAFKKRDIANLETVS